MPMPRFDAHCGGRRIGGGVNDVDCDSRDAHLRHLDTEQTGVT